MQLVLSAISAGGLVGASNQYLCLLIVSVAARLDLIRLTPQVDFIESWWFIGIVAVFWLLTIAPAYGSLLSPGVMNAVNAITNFLSGFVVPLSAALLSLASIGVIVEMRPDLIDILRTLQLFNEEGGIGVAGFVIAGGSALTASALTGSKFLAKPALSTVTGTTGAASAPAYATLENLASIVLMILLYVLTRINPWLLVGLLALVTLLVLGVLAYGVYQLWKLGKGIGQVIHLIETRPIAGLSVVAEFLIWGSGWLTWGDWNRGVLRLLIWALWILLILVVIPVAVVSTSAALAAVPPLTVLPPALGVMAETLILVLGLYIGLRSARGLMKKIPDAAPAPTAARAELPT